MCKSKSTSFSYTLIISLILVFTISSANAAWRLNWGLGADIEYSDNNSRANSNEDDSITLQPRGQINAVHEGPNFDAEIGAANEYRSRLSGDLGSSNNFDLDGNLNWKISPGLFEWSFEDHFNSEFPIDIRSNPNENNKQDVNSFSTGPSFTPRVFNRTNLIFNGLYIRTDAEKTDIDNDRLQAKFGIQRQMTPTSTLSLNYLYEDTDFDENSIDPLVGNVDFDRDNYFLQYGIEKPSLSLTAQLGYTEVERDEGVNRRSEGANNLITLNYILNSTSSFVLTAYDQYSDFTSDAGSSGQSGLAGGFGSIGGGGSTGVIGNTPLGDIVVDATGDTVDSEGFLVAFNKRFTKIETGFQYFQRDDDHDLVDINDRESNGGVVNFGLPLNSITLLSFIGEYRTTDFDIGDREDDDLLLQFTGEYFARRNLSFLSSVEYRDRDSTIAGEDFDEFLLRIGITFTNL